MNNIRFFLFLLLLVSLSAAITCEYAGSDPDPMLIANAANFSAYSDLATAVTLFVNKTNGTAYSFAMANDGANNWSVLLPVGGINGTKWAFQINCSNTTDSNVTDWANLTLVLPDMTLEITAPSSVATNDAFGIGYNITSDGGYDFDARWLAVNISTSFAVISTINMTYPTIDTFDTNINGVWVAIAPNSTGTYSFNYILGDVWGNQIKSQTLTITVEEGEGMSGIYNVGIAFVFILMSMLCFYISFEYGNGGRNE